MKTNTFPPSLLGHLLPSLTGVRVQQVAVFATHVLLRLAATAPTALCPICATPSASVHSSYTRQLTDLAWGTASVQILLRVRKFRCACPTCPRRVFTERLPALAAPYARQTPRRQSLLRALGLALGGRAAVRLARQLRLSTTRTSVLRLVRQTAPPRHRRLRVIGVDDWAFRRGHHYGTIIVDLERHQPVDLLPDRQPGTLVVWLRRHPSIEIISRDRASAYAEAATRGAPQALQVADRLHLLKNLTDALERFFLNKRTLLKAAVAEAPAPAADQAEPPSPPVPAVAPGAALPAAASPSPVEQIAQQRHARVIEQYQQIHALAAQQIDVATIAEQVGVSRVTVYRYLHMHEPPARKQPHRRGSRLLGPYEAYLRRRWQEGCRNAKQLWREITAQGYRYSSHTSARRPGAGRDRAGGGQGAAALHGAAGRPAVDGAPAAAQCLASGLSGPLVCGGGERGAHPAPGGRI